MKYWLGSLVLNLRLNSKNPDFISSSRAIESGSYLCIRRWSDFKCELVLCRLSFESRYHVWSSVGPVSVDLDGLDFYWLAIWRDYCCFIKWSVFIDWAPLPNLLSFDIESTSLLLFSFKLFLLWANMFPYCVWTMLRCGRSGRSNYDALLLLALAETYFYYSKERVTNPGISVVSFNVLAGG